MSRRYDTKRRKKWNRRILLCQSIKRLTLTHVKDDDNLVWLSSEDITDLLQSTSSGKKRNGRNDMTGNELMPRLRPIINSDFMKTSYYDKTVSIGGHSRRYRAISFAVTDMELLEKYIEYCAEQKAKI